LLNKSTSENLLITVADVSLAFAESKIQQHKNGLAISIDISNKAERQAAIQKADIVVSMLPARLHFKVAKDCLNLKKIWLPLLIFQMK